MLLDGTTGLHAHMHADLKCGLQAVLEVKTSLELPSFLLVSFMRPMQVDIEEPNARSRAVCAVSAAAILRALIAAGKTKMAASLVEDDLLEYGISLFVTICVRVHCCGGLAWFRTS